MQIDILVLDGVFDTGLSGLLDVFGVADELGGGQAPVTVRLVGLRRRVRTAQGLVVPVERAREGPAPDLVVVPALGAKMPEALRPALARADVRDACALLAERAGGGARLAAACTGTFVLAAAGVLEGRAATTSWWLAPLFRELHPGVALDESRMVVPADGVVTAGAALAHIDLALWIVRQRSPALAGLVARYLVIDPRPSQAAFAIADHLAHADALVEKFEGWARGHLAQRFSLGAAAQAIGASERTLARRLQRVLGKTPLGYVQDLRVERAVRRLQDSGASVDEIAAEVGYADGVTLRTLLRRKLGRGVRELRRRP